MFDHSGEPRSRKAVLQDRLTGTLIGLANAINGNEHLINTRNSRLLIAALKCTCPACDIHPDDLVEMIDDVQHEKYRIVPNCAECANRCGRTDDYDMMGLWAAEEESRILRCRILEGVRNIAAGLSETEEAPRETILLLFNALFAVGMGDWNGETLMTVVRQVEQQQA